MKRYLAEGLSGYSRIAFEVDFAKIEDAIEYAKASTELGAVNVRVIDKTTWEGVWYGENVEAWR